ncbi:MAG: hypothetical protein AAGH60_10800 [Pseudomonadota bacterium]
MTARIGAALIDAEVVNGLGTVNDTIGFDFISQSDQGEDLSAVGIGGGVDAYIEHGSSQFFGDAIIAGFDAVFVEDDTTQRQAAADLSFVDVLPIDGTTSLGAIFVGDPLQADVDIEYTQFGGYLGIAFNAETLGLVTGADPAGDPMSAYFGFGAYASYSQLDLDSNVFNVDNPLEFAALDEEVDVFSIGPMVTAALSTTFEGGFRAAIKGDAAVLYTNADLDAVQTASNLGLPLSVSDSENDIAFLARLTAMLGYDVSEDATLGIQGSVTARNDYYSIVNPRSGPGLDASDPTSYNPGPVKLDQAFLFEGEIGLFATILF